MRRLCLVCILMLLGFPGAPVTTLSGQDTLSTPPPQTVDSLDLVFEREAFVYPMYDRRNPFLPLVAGDEFGPRFEEIRLTGIIHSVDPDRSVAMFVTRTGQEQRTEQTDASQKSFRVRRGDTLGNVRILEIHETRVVVLVEEFGLTEQRVLELPRPGEGGL